MTEYDTATMAGQRLMAGFDGTEFNDDIKYLIKDLKIGGLILFSQNIKTPEQTKKLCTSAQEFAMDQGLFPLFLAIDQEGGNVARLKKPYFTEFPGNPHIKGKKAVVDFAAITAQELKRVRINMNLAPVLDFTAETENSIMKKRAFTGSPQKIADLGITIIKELQARGIMACAKHFPGIGRTTLDSHLTLPQLDADKALLEKTDVIPFTAAKENAVAAIMLSHILYTSIDSTWPASLSPAIARKWLRDEMGYQGIVITDDLDMKAVKHDIKTCIHQILKSDIDIALICHKGPDIEKAFHFINAGLNTDRHQYEKGLISLERILNVKNKYLNQIHINPVP
ncbi:MAG: glycoside hydrolase family 3 N-terminal domain-containing protein [Thermodesulfobacteriota bacterium]|nr:glycoside hydrolase family 3 N-terminal domain-containing protein [Thermodesulfobacteriota bacterium]